MIRFPPVAQQGSEYEALNESWVRFNGYLFRSPSAPSWVEPPPENLSSPYIKCQVVDHRGNCFAGNNFDGVLFRDAFLLQNPKPGESFIGYYGDLPVGQGEIRYGGMTYQLCNGVIYHGKKTIGKISMGGDFNFQTESESVGGKFYDHLGISAKLYSGGKEIFNNFQDNVIFPIWLLQSNPRPVVNYLSFQLIVRDDGAIEARVPLQPYFHPGYAPDSEEKTRLETLINESLREKLEGRFDFLDPHTQQRYPLRFSVELTDESGNAIAFYRDMSPDCLLAGYCHTVAPTTGMISVESITETIPHEYMHYLNNDDEYYDPSDPGRWVTGPESIMHSYDGELQARHLHFLLKTARERIHPDLIIVPAIASQTRADSPL